MAQSQFSSPEHLKYRVPARLCQGAHDHAMDGIRYFVMGLRERGGGVAAGLRRSAEEVTICQRSMSGSRNELGNALKGDFHKIN